MKTLLSYLKNLIINIQSMNKYISKEGLEKLKMELQELKGAVRKEITKRIEEAKSYGDLSENAEYIEAREAQAFNEVRIRELEENIKNAIIIEESKKSGVAGVNVGDVVEVSNSKGEKQTFKIVGSNEADPLENKISNESPLGKAFLSRIPGEDVEAITPRGKIKYKIISVR